MLEHWRTPTSLLGMPTARKPEPPRSKTRPSAKPTSPLRPPRSSFQRFSKAMGPKRCKSILQPPPILLGPQRFLTSPPRRSSRRARLGRQTIPPKSARVPGLEPHLLRIRSLASSPGFGRLQTETQWPARRERSGGLQSTARCLARKQASGHLPPIPRFEPILQQYIRSQSKIQPATKRRAPEPLQSRSRHSTIPRVPQSSRCMTQPPSIPPHP